MLHVPDFLGYADAIAMARDHRNAGGARIGAQKGRQRVVAAARRPRDPSGQRPGRRFLSAPSREELAVLAEQLKRARELAVETVRWAAGLPFPDVARRLRIRRTAASRRVPDECGPDRLLPRVWTSLPTNTKPTFEEYQVPYSNALHSQLKRARRVSSSARWRAALNRRPPARRGPGRSPTKLASIGSPNPYRMRRSFARSGDRSSL